MHKVIQKIENSIALTNDMIVEYPENTAFKSIKDVLESLRDELLKSEPDQNEIGNIKYALVRNYQAVLHVEKTPFGKDVGELLVDLQRY